ncbi:MAG: hypothetical protein ACYCOU_02470 [Sulfobacillus sp.]
MDAPETPCGSSRYTLDLTSGLGWQLEIPTFGDRLRISEVSFYLVNEAIAPPGLHVQFLSGKQVFFRTDSRVLRRFPVVVFDDEFENFSLAGFDSVSLQLISDFDQRVTVVVGYCFKRPEKSRKYLQTRFCEDLKQMNTFLRNHEGNVKQVRISCDAPERLKLTPSAGSTVVLETSCCIYRELLEEAKMNVNHNHIGKEFVLDLSEVSRPGFFNYIGFVSDFPQDYVVNLELLMPFEEGFSTGGSGSDSDSESDSGSDPESDSGSDPDGAGGVQEIR